MTGTFWERTAASLPGHVWIPLQSEEWVLRHWPSFNQGASWTNQSRPSFIPPPLLQWSSLTSQVFASWTQLLHTPGSVLSLPHQSSQLEGGLPRMKGFVWNWAYGVHGQRDNTGAESLDRLRVYEAHNHIQVRGHNQRNRVTLREGTGLSTFPFFFFSSSLHMIFQTKNKNLK